MTTRVIIMPEDVIQDKRLGRHVEHDPASLKYPISVDLSAPLKSAAHERKIPILNQGNLGSCTGNAGTGLLGTEPFFSRLNPEISRALDEKFAVDLYSHSSQLDEYTDGAYPPDDTGSSGLGVGRALKAEGVITGYHHAFGLNHSLQALQKRPFVTGVPWFSSFDSPGPNGHVKLDLSSPIRGGHEIEALRLDVVNGDPNAPTGRITFANSWGTSWGDQGYFEMDFYDFGLLLQRQGDVMTFNLPKLA